MKAKLFQPAFHQIRQKKTNIVAITFLLLAFTLSAFVAREDPFQAVLSQLEKFRTAYPQEKVYLHLDKPFYATGDNIWFKAYVVNAEEHRVSGLSKILNVELINEQDSIEQSLRLPLTAGIAWGDFRLADSLSEGNYRIRAYTNYMRNFDDAYFFDKTILIGNVSSGNIVTTVNYKYKTTDNAQQVRAAINYADMDGHALAGKEVTYNVQLDAKNIAKGKAVTDEKGDIHISFPNGQSSLIASGRLNTVIRIDKQSSISKSFPVKPTSSETDVQFFPEGGNLVKGISSKVAFKAVGADGLGKNVTGYIFNSSGQKMLEFKSDYAGMGSFILLPAAGQTYTATIKFPDGSENKVALPWAQAESLALSADNSDSTRLTVKINASPATIAAAGPVTLVAQSNSVVKFVSKYKIDKASISASIPKNLFPTGILQLTLFDQQNQPVAERLVFINHHDFLNVTLSGPKTSAIRKKVKMDLDVKDTSGNPVFCTFSVSVTDAQKIPVNVNEETTILTSLLLTSDLKGYVEQPNYYFTTMDEQRVRELDNLMLTQGWRRFAWKNILAGNFPKFTFEPEYGITISGRVTQHKKPVAGGKVTLLSSAGGLFMLDTLTDADGRFAFKNLIFPDSTRFVVQARTANDKKFVDIKLDKTSPQLVTKSKNGPAIEVNVNKRLITYLKNSYNQFEELRRNGKINLLSEVKIVARKERTVKGSANLAGRADAIITADQLDACVSLDQCLQGKVPGLVIQDSMAFLTRSMYSSLSSRTPMTLILDGVRVEPTFLSMINPFDVEGIEVLKGATAAIYGTFGFGGVLLITTKGSKGKTNYNTYSGGIFTYMPKGYYKSREFYMPNYKTSKTNVQAPDLRTTIFWHPNLIVKDGKASFEYFNSDGKGPYQVIIEGIDAQGRLARYVYNYIVN